MRYRVCFANGLGSITMEATLDVRDDHEAQLLVGSLLARLNLGRVGEDRFRLVALTDQSS